MCKPNTKQKKSSPAPRRGKSPGKRQKARRGILVVSFLLFPATYFYLSPYIAIEGPLLDGVLGGSLFLFMALFALAIPFGRTWCGWLCPASALGEISQWANPQPHKRMKNRWIKWLIWIPWLSVVTSVIIRGILKGSIHEVQLTYMTHHGVSGVHLVDFNDRIIPFLVYYLVLTLVFFLPMVLGRKAFCHYICWMSPFMILGQKLGRNLRGPQLHITLDTQACTQCGLCSKNCSMGIPIHATPGALTHRDCILCGVCIEKCPRGALRYQWKGEKRKSRGRKEKITGTPR